MQLEKLRSAAAEHITVRFRDAEDAARTGFEVWVPGVPFPQPRPRARIKGGRVFVQNPRGPASTWKRTVSEHVGALYAWRDCEGFREPLEVALDFVLPRPASHWTKSGALRSKIDCLPIGAKTGDLDNLEKSTLDGLQTAGVLGNDSHVVALASRKSYTPDRDGPTGCLIEVRLYTEGPA